VSVSDQNAHRHYFSILLFLLWYNNFYFKSCHYCFFCVILFWVAQYFLRNNKINEPRTKMEPRSLRVILLRKKSKISSTLRHCAFSCHPSVIPHFHCSWPRLVLPMQGIYSVTSTAPPEEWNKWSGKPVGKQSHINLWRLVCECVTRHLTTFLHYQAIKKPKEFSIMTIFLHYQIAGYQHISVFFTTNNAG
jgi:hypothetical protein